MNRLSLTSNKSSGSSSNSSVHSVNSLPAPKSEKKLKNETKGTNDHIIRKVDNEKRPKSANRLDKMHENDKSKTITNHKNRSGKSKFLREFEEKWKKAEEKEAIKKMKTKMDMTKLGVLPIKKTLKIVSKIHEKKKIEQIILLIF